MTIDGTGDGGAKGKGGRKGERHKETITEKDENGIEISYQQTVIDNYPGLGTEGKPGAKGFVVVYWDKESET